MHPGDILIAESVCTHISGNMGIDFKLHGDGWTHEEAKKHFKDREALVRVRNILIDEGEKLCKNPID